MRPVGESTSAREARGRGRGNSYDRRARRRWLVSADAPFGGNGKRVPCYWCGTMLDAYSVTTDRYPKAGSRGGTYRRGNIVPACLSCNAARGDGT